MMSPQQLIYSAVSRSLPTKTFLNPTSRCTPYTNHKRFFHVQTIKGRQIQIQFLPKNNYTMERPVAAAAAESLVKFRVLGQVQSPWSSSESLVKFRVLGQVQSPWSSSESLVKFRVLGQVQSPWSSSESLVKFRVLDQN